MTSAGDYTRGYADGFAHASVDPSGSALYGNGYRAGATDAGANQGPPILTGDAPHEGDVLTYTNGHWDALPPTGGGGGGIDTALQFEASGNSQAGFTVIRDAFTEEVLASPPDGMGLSFDDGQPKRFTATERGIWLAELVGGVTRDDTARVELILGVNGDVVPNFTGNAALSNWTDVSLATWGTMQPNIPLTHICFMDVDQWMYVIGFSENQTADPYVPFNDLELRVQRLA